MISVNTHLNISSLGATKMTITRDNKPQPQATQQPVAQQPAQQPQGQNMSQVPQQPYVDPNAQAYAQPQQPYQQPYGQQPQQPYQQPNYNAGYANFSSNGSFANMNQAGGLDRIQQLRSGYGRAIPVNDSASQAYEVQKFYADLVEKTKEELSFTILTPEKHSVTLCAIVVHKSLRGANGQEYAAAHTIIVEGATPLNPRTAQYGNMQIAIPSVPGDIYTDRTYARIVEALRAHYGNNVMVLDAQASVIPRELTVENNKAELTHILSCATDAVNGMLNLVSATPRILTAGVIRPDQQMRIVNSIDYNPLPQYTASGQNIRSDISVTLSASTHAQGFENEMASMPLVTTDMYVDLVYIPMQQHQMGYFGAPMMQQYHSTLSYIPRVVITNVQNQELFASLEETLLGLVNAMSVVANNGFATVWKPRDRKATIDFRDFSAVGYEIPALSADGKPGQIVIDGDHVKASQLVADTVATNQVMFSMDIPEVGDTSWITNAFIGAANNNAEAIAQIIQAANNLCNGEFSKIWDNSGIVDNDFTRIHLGNFLDNGVKKDLRHVDRLALLNLFGRTGRLEKVQEYDQTFIPDNASTDFRLDQRFNVLNAALGDGAITLKGYARRVTFRSRFLQCLEAALRNAGVMIQQNTGNWNGTTIRRMTAQDYAAYAMGHQVAYQPGIFQYGGIGNFQNVAGARIGNWGTGYF